jgi:topoisomerase IA-like protein
LAAAAFEPTRRTTGGSVECPPPCKETPMPAKKKAAKKATKKKATKKKAAKKRK